MARGKSKGCIQAAKDAVSELFQAHTNAKAASNNSSDEEYVPNIGGITEHSAHRFMEKLPDHLLFTTGFDKKDEDSCKLCLCPSSETKSGRWLNMFHLPDGSINVCDKHFIPFGLMEHLRAVGYNHKNPLHVGAHAYLQSFYDKCHPSGQQQQ